MSEKSYNKSQNNILFLKSVKWIALNIFLPALPMFVKFLVNTFSNSNVSIFELNELLYYNFFICILLCEQINKRKSLFSYLITYLIFLICVCDILLIAFVSTGQQNDTLVWIFAVAVALACSCFGSIYIIKQEKSDSERNDFNE